MKNNSFLRKKQIENFSEFAKRLAKQAGNLLMKDYGKTQLVKIVDRDEKGLITRADIKSNNFIVNSITHSYPSHSIHSEELQKSKTHEFNWIVDPLDGTNNYRRGDPNFSVSIALEFRNKILFGVVYAPVLEEFYWSTLNQGAFYEKNGKKIKIRVSGKKSLAMFTMSVTTDIDWNNKKISNSIISVVTRIKKIRHFRRRMIENTSLELCHVAQGRYDAHLNILPKLWDIAAGQLIVTESGGTISVLKNGIYLATNGIIHNKFVEALNK